MGERIKILELIEKKKKLQAGKIPWRRARQPTPEVLPGEFHGEAWWTTIHGDAKLDTPEQLTLSLSYIK